MPGTMADSMCFRPSRPCSGESGCTETSVIDGVELAQPPAGADERAARAEAGDEMRERPSVCSQISGAVVS